MLGGPVKLDGVDGVPGDDNEDMDDIDEKDACSLGDEGPSPGVDAAAAVAVAAADKEDDDELNPKEVPIRLFEVRCTLYEAVEPL